MPLSRRDFLQRIVLGAAAAPWAPHALAADAEDGSEVVWDRADRAAYRAGGPLDLAPWPYGKTSSAPDTVLMFRGDGRHRHYGTGPIADEVRVLWRHRMLDYRTRYYGRRHVWAGTGWTGQAAKLGDYVFVGSTGRGLYAFEAATGRLRWRYDARRMFKASVCVYDNRLFIGNVDNWLRCIDAATGDLVWRVDTGRDLDSSACVDGGWLYIGGENGHVRCMDPATGRLRWKTRVGGLTDGPTQGSYGCETSPAVDRGQVFVGTYDGRVHCLDAETGFWRWQARTSADTDASAVLDEDRVYVAAEEDAPYVSCFDRATGELVWRAAGEAGFWATPALADGTLFASDHNGTLWALDARSGRTRWTHELGVPSWSSPCVVDGRIVFGAFDGRVRCVDAQSGALVWSVRLGGRIHSTPCVVDGRIYIGTDWGWFYALGADRV